MRLKTSLICPALLLLLACGVHADANELTPQSSSTSALRPSLVFGFGIGLSPVTMYSSEFADDSHIGLPLHFMIGTSSGDHHVVGLEVLVSQFKTRERSFDGHQGFAGLTWRRYPGRPGRSSFTVLGAGVEMFGLPRYSTNAGPGLLAGVGSELHRFFQIGLYFNAGYSLGPDTVHFGISVLLSLVMP